MDDINVNYNTKASDLMLTLSFFLTENSLEILHKKSPYKHFLIAVRQVFLLILLPIFIYRYGQGFWWILPAVLQGFVIFSFSVLLHEVIHHNVFAKPRPVFQYYLGVFYGIITGMSYSQFRQWHLDHHKYLGTDDLDPKRANLSPKRNAVWYKLLYWTPALFYLYFSGVAKTVKHYPAEVRQKIKKERLLGIALQLGILALFFSISPAFAFKAYIIPVFFVFPVAFALNRLGQHYIIDPNDIAQWSTLVRSNLFWDFLFLFSAYHLEHHYYPGVPFYNLPKLQKQLIPFYQQRKMPMYEYHQILYIWFVKNHFPHTKPNASPQKA